MKPIRLAWLTWMLTVGAACSQGNPELRPNPSVPGDDLVTLAVVHTTDIHGFILPHRKPLKSPSSKDFPVTTLGGIETLAGYLSILREDFGEGLLLVDSGDMFQGTMLSNRFQGAPVVRAMNHVGYAASALGNHEFDFGPEGQPAPDKDPFEALKQRGREASFPILSCNVYDRRTGQPIDWTGFASWHLVEVAGIRVAFVGGATPTTPTMTPAYVGEHLEFRPLAPEIRRASQLARDNGADLVIALVHAGGSCTDHQDHRDTTSCDEQSELFQLAGELSPRDIDLLMGGHTHSLVAHTVNGIPVIESGAHLAWMGMTSLHVNRRTGRVVSVDIHPPTPLCIQHVRGLDTCLPQRVDGPIHWEPARFRGRTVPARQFLDSLLTPDERRTVEEARTPLGVRAGRHLYRWDRGISPLGLFVTGVMQDLFPHADVFLYNQSGLRAPLLAGDLTVEDISQVLPFDATPFELRLTAGELTDLLRIATSGAHSGPVVRGLRVIVGPSRDPGIDNDWNGDGVRSPWERNRLVRVTHLDGTELDPQRTYVMVTNSYLGMGGSSFRHVTSQLPPERTRSLGHQPLRTLVIDWLRERPGLELGTPDDPWTQPDYKL